MEPNAITDIGRDALYVLIITAAPAMMTALIVGLVIGLLQALTQIQEATLTFVPKILAVFLVLALTMSFMMGELKRLTERIQEQIVNIE